MAVRDAISHVAKACEAKDRGDEIEALLELTDVKKFLDAEESDMCEPSDAGRLGQGLLGIIEKSAQNMPALSFLAGEALVRLLMRMVRAQSMLRRE